MGGAGVGAAAALCIHMHVCVSGGGGVYRHTFCSAVKFPPSFTCSGLHCTRPLGRCECAHTGPWYMSVIPGDTRLCVPVSKYDGYALSETLLLVYLFPLLSPSSVVSPSWSGNNEHASVSAVQLVVCVSITLQL